MDSLILGTKSQALKLVISALASIQLVATTAYADEASVAVESVGAVPIEAAKAAENSEPEPPWDLSFTLNFVSDYRARGISQTWLAPAVQGSIDLTHESGFYSGVWASNVSDETTAGAHEEIDVYVGFGNDIKTVDGLSYTTGLYGYFYPSGNYSKFDALTTVDGNKRRETYDTFELMGGLTYKWLTAKAWVTLTDYSGQNRKTGWTRGTKGSTYYELSANVPLPFWGLDLVAGVGRTHVPGKVSSDPAFLLPNSDFDGNLVKEKTLDYTDYKLGISKTFEVKKAATFTTSLTYIGATNSDADDFWGKNGYGGGSVIPNSKPKNIGQQTLVLNVGITF